MIRVKVTDGHTIFVLLAEADGGLTLETLNSVLPGATNLIISLDEDVYLSIRGGKIFNPYGWDINLAYLAHFSSRSATPANRLQTSAAEDKIINRIKSFLYYMPKNQPALNENCKKYKHEELVNGGCVTPISSSLAMTYKHRSHLKLRIYEDESVSNQHSVVIIRKVSDSSTYYKMKVVWVDDRRDIILLSFCSASERFADYPGMIREPEEFEWLIALGLSHKTEKGRHLTCRSGRICSLIPDKTGRIKASTVIDGGDSGALCFSNEGALIGMMVSSWHSSPRLSRKYDNKNVEKEIEDASIHPGESLILSGKEILTTIAAYYDFPIPERNPLSYRTENRKRKNDGTEVCTSRYREDEDSYGMQLLFDEERLEQLNISN